MLLDATNLYSYETAHVSCCVNNCKSCVKFVASWIWACSWHWMHWVKETKAWRTDQNISASVCCYK